MQNRTRSGTIISLTLCIFCTCVKNPSGSDPGEDVRAVASDKNALIIIYAPGDSAGSVTRNLGLPHQGGNGTRISWKSSDSAKIAVDGTVNRPPVGSEDAAVTLFATIAKGAARDSRSFALIVRTLADTQSSVGDVVIDADGNRYTTVKIGD